MGNRNNQAGSGTSQGTSQGGSAEGCRAGVPRGGNVQSVACSTLATTRGLGSGRRRSNTSICRKKGIDRQREPGERAETTVPTVDRTQPTRCPVQRPAHGDVEPPPSSSIDRSPLRHDTRLHSTEPRANGARQQRTWPRGATQSRPSGFCSASANCPPSGAPRPEEAGRE